MSKGQFSKGLMVAGLNKLVLYDPIRGLTCYELKLKKWQFIWLETVILFIVQGSGLTILLDCRRTSHHDIVR